jgi:hypothetical protein
MSKQSRTDALQAECLSRGYVWAAERIAELERASSIMEAELKQLRLLVYSPDMEKDDG